MRCVLLRPALCVAIGIAAVLPAAGSAASGTHSKKDAALSIEFADAGALAQPADPLGAEKAPPSKSVPSALLAPAPMPNEDLDDPVHAAGPKGPSLTPALITSRRGEFQGDGFAASSNLDHAIEERTPPAAGFNLNVPVR